MRRFPGLDGLLILLLDALLVVVVVLKPATGLGPVVALTLLASALWLVGAGWSRRVRLPGGRATEVTVLVVIPTHNNAGTIAEVVTRCLERHPQVLVVDDGSHDDSAALAEAAGAKVLRHEQNRGKGAALDSALRYALEHGFSHIVAIDADGQHFPEDLPRFLDAVRRRPGAVHAGVRDMAEAPIGSVRARANSNFWVWVECGRWLRDTQCGYRAYPVRPVLGLGLPPSRYQWEVEVLTRAVWGGVPVEELPCRVYYPPVDERVSSYRKVVDTARVTWLNATLVAERILWPPRWVRASPRTDWRGQHRGTMWGWRLFLFILRTLGRRACLVAVSPMGLFYWLAAPNLRAGLDAFHRRVDPSATASRRSLWALQTMVIFAWSIVDRFAAMVVPEQVPLRRDGVEHLKQTLYGSDRGVLLLSAHLGTPEVASAMLRDKGRKVNVVMHVAEGDPYQTLLQEQLQGGAPAVIPLNADGSPATIEILHALRRNEAVALKVDRVVDPRTAPVQFLGDTMQMPTGPLVLAALSGAQTVLVTTFRQPDGSYLLAANEPRTYAFTSRKDRDADLQRWAQELADTLAEWARAYPQQWFNFHDPWAEVDATKR